METVGTLQGAIFLLGLEVAVLIGVVATNNPDKETRQIGWFAASLFFIFAAGFWLKARSGY